MKKYYLIAILIFGIIFSLRVYAQGGFEKPEKIAEFEAISSQFSPLRDFLSNQVNRLLPQPQAALLNGMLLGVQTSLPPDFKKALTNTSTIHIVVVSGQNLTLVGGFCLGFLGYLGRKKTILLSLLVCFLYALLTGLQVPVLRALLMFGFSSTAQIFNRDKDGVWILLLSAGIMLIFNPNWLLSVSFQLSFLATVGVVVVAPEIVRVFGEFRVPNLISQDLAVSLAAQALTAPVIAINFHQISLNGVLVNALVLWTVAVIMISGTLSLAGSVINLMFGQLLALIPGVFLTYFVYIVSFFNQGYVYIGRINLLIWLGYYILILAIFLWLRQKNQEI